MYKQILLQLTCLASPHDISSFPPQGKLLTMMTRSMASRATKYLVERRPISSKTTTSVRFNSSLLDASVSSLLRHPFTMFCEKDRRLLVTVSGKTRCTWLPSHLSCSLACPRQHLHAQHSVETGGYGQLKLVALSCYKIN